MADLNRILGQLLNSGAASGFAGGLAGGLAGSMLTGKSGRKLGKKALKYGGMAAVGAMAYAAYKNYSANQGPAGPPLPAPGYAPPLDVPPPDSGFLPRQDDTQAREALGLTLVRAMIAAGRADGRLDAEESQAIFNRIQALDLAEDEKSLLIAEMDQPANMDAILRAATTPEIATEIYTASLLAIQVDEPSESNYLAMLAARLKLPRDLVTAIHQQVAAQGEPAAG